MITRDTLQFEWVSGMTLAGSGHIMLRDNTLKLQCEKITPRNKYGEYGKCKTFYFIDDDPREFTDLDDLIEAYNEKFPGEDETPEVEVQYIRVTVNRKNKKIIPPKEE